MGKTVATPWDPADHLNTEEDMAAYLEAALEEGDPAQRAPQACLDGTPSAPRHSTSPELSGIPLTL